MNNVIKKYFVQNCQSSMHVLLVGTVLLLSACDGASSISTTGTEKTIDSGESASVDLNLIRISGHRISDGLDFSVDVKVSSDTK